MSHDREPPHGPGVVSDPDAAFHEQVMARFVRQAAVPEEICFPCDPEPLPVAKKKPHADHDKAVDVPDLDALLTEARAKITPPGQFGTPPLPPFVADVLRTALIQALQYAAARVASDGPAALQSLIDKIQAGGKPNPAA